MLKNNYEFRRGGQRRIRGLAQKMLIPIIKKYVRPWIAYNQKALINGTFGTDRQIFSAIDVGCSEAAYFPFILDKFPSCNLLLGLDVRRNVLVQAKQKSDSRTDFIAADALALPLKDSTFCLVFAKDLVHHVKRPIKALKEMKRVSKSKIVIVEANRPNPLMLLWETHDHQHFTLNQLRNLLDRADLKLEKLKQLRTYSFSLLLWPTRNPIMFLWNVFVLIFLGICYLVPPLLKTFSSTLSFLFTRSHPSNNIIYAYSKHGKSVL